MVAERTPTRYQRIRLFVSSSSPLALYPNTLYSTLYHPLAARILPALSPAATPPHTPLDRVRRPPSLYISFPLAERCANSLVPKRAQSWQPSAIGSRTTSLSGWNRRYPADDRPGNAAWNTFVVVVVIVVVVVTPLSSTRALSRWEQGLAFRDSRRDFDRFDDSNSLFPRPNRCR